MKNRFLLVLPVLLVFISSLCYSQSVDYKELGLSVVPEGLKPGDHAPDFTGYDQNGKQVVLSKVLADGPVVMFFYRGKWSVECGKILRNCQDSLSIITGIGANIIAITPESIENVEQTVKFNGLTYKVIYDCQEKIMKDYQTMYPVTPDYSAKIKKDMSIDIAANNEREAARLPVTATYIINREGIITAVHFDPDFTKRASVKWMITNLSSAL